MGRLPVILERALDMLDCALLIVNDEGEIEYGNRVAAALLERGHGGLTIADGTLSARPREVRELVTQAVSLACVEMQPSGFCVPHPGAEPETWLRMVVAPIYYGAAQACAGGASRGCASRAAVWILNTEAPGVPSEELVAALFELSRAEARLALSVLKGNSVAEHARANGVGVATVRSQLHSIFSKTGVQRQAQLVALLSRVPALQVPR
jgi:DNA-binding CsgD family transcriptional regulator